MYVAVIFAFLLGLFSVALPFTREEKRKPGKREKQAEEDEGENQQ